ncbi:MAG: peptidase M48, partial [Acidaminococcaceae bacterium]
MKKYLVALMVLCFLCLGYTPPAEAGLISQAQEIAMGREVAAQLEAQYGLVQDEELQARVERIGQRLVA